MIHFEAEQVEMKLTHHETAILLIAHGSRRKEANEELREVQKKIIDQEIFAIVEVGYLEIAQPTIPKAAESCMKEGIQRLLMVPYFLSPGSHVVNDLEKHRQQIAKKFPQLEVKLCKPLGVHPKMVEIVLDRIAEGMD